MQHNSCKPRRLLDFSQTSHCALHSTQGVALCSVLDKDIMKRMNLTDNITHSLTIFQKPFIHCKGVQMQKFSEKSCIYSVMWEWKWTVVYVKRVLQLYVSDVLLQKGTHKKRRRVSILQIYTYSQNGPNAFLSGLGYTLWRVAAWFFWPFVWFSLAYAGYQTVLDALLLESSPVKTTILLTITLTVAFTECNNESCLTTGILKCLINEIGLDTTIKLSY